MFHFSFKRLVMKAVGLAIVINIVVPFFRGFLSDIKTKKGFKERMTNGYRETEKNITEKCNDVCAVFTTVGDTIYPTNIDSAHAIGWVELVLAAFVAALGTALGTAFGVVGYTNIKR